MESIGSTPKFSKSMFTPLLISMLGIASTCLAIILYHLLVVKYCIRRQQQQQQRQTTGTPLHPVPGSGGPIAAAGVDEKVLKTIPVLAYSAEKHSLFRADDHQSECAVCLGELEDGEMVRLLPNCRHAFHVSCIDQWFMGHTSCPLCRSAIVARVVVSPSAPVVDDDDRTDHHQLRSSIHDREINGLVGGLRHCASMAVLPVERKSVAAELKRSLSMDQSFVVIDIQRESESERACSSSSSSSSSSEVDRRSYMDRSMRQLDRVSSKLLGSFSRLRTGRVGSGNPLPY